MPGTPGGEGSLQALVPSWLEEGRGAPGTSGKESGWGVQPAQSGWRRQRSLLSGELCPPSKADTGGGGEGSPGRGRPTLGLVVLPLRKDPRACL